MRLDTTAHNLRELQSPYIIKMEGDFSKMRPLEHSGISSDDQTMKVNYSLKHAPDTYSCNIIHRDGSQRSIISEMDQDASMMLQDVPQITSWSNVVRSGSRIKFTRSSDETLLTSNTTNLKPNIEYLAHRSHSYCAETDESSFSYLPKSIAIGYESTITTRSSQNVWRTSHSSLPSNRDTDISKVFPPLRSGIEGPSTLLNSSLINSNTHSTNQLRDIKSRSINLGLCYSTYSLEDSTDRTTPMSSPSMSPHMTPLQLPKSGTHEFSKWHLSPILSNPNSDADEIYLDSLHRHLNLRHPQSMHQNHQKIPLNQEISSPNKQLEQPNHPSQQIPLRSKPFSRGKMSPPKHVDTCANSSSKNHAMHSPRPGTKLSAAQFHPGLVNRSSTEILKTLLRKKACLYEPETSFAIALVTWLIGRRLTISFGFFSRQQLQSGVHSCVGSKISEGHVTRTKVNRCMQIILNSCFHYVIPRPDGSDEKSDNIRQQFLREASSDDYLLRTLSPPWNYLSIETLFCEESHTEMILGSDDDASLNSPKYQGKCSPSATYADDSLDSGKRSVLLCFNENIRSASDVFRCHNEFIRDVAHTANLYLSTEEWRCFFSGTKIFKKKSITDNASPKYFSFAPELNDPLDQRGLAEFRTSWCAKRYEHYQSLCIFAHVEVNRGWLRRNPCVYHYKPLICPSITPLQDTEECVVNKCPYGVHCNYAHSKEEIQYHPLNYKKHLCDNQADTCILRDICPNIHSNKTYESMGVYHTQNVNRHSKRYQYDSLHRGAKKRDPSIPGETSNIAKRPLGSPMLYIDPAPVSEFEIMLSLPGLKALFRDFSTAIFNAHQSDKQLCEYGLFGYKFLKNKNLTDKVIIAPSENFS